ncbi:hypothetical protein [Collinsella vaginalis]|uniref:hypothetical protein n=1 Tax=Collinsella vaginalis TaxID=1870987 RepID=UPI000A26DA6E|nr:hypothetical protein [Collinsella vaginalis]
MSNDTTHAAGPADLGIEGASAGTANQSTTSKFAYILTAVVLGGMILIGCAIASVAVSALQTYVMSRDYSGYNSTWSHRWDYDDGYGDYDYDDYYDDYYDDAWLDSFLDSSYQG